MGVMTNVCTLSNVEIDTTQLSKGPHKVGEAGGGPRHGKARPARRAC